VDVIGHQDIRVQGAAVACGRLPKESEIHLSIAIREEARRSVIAALNDVQRNSREL
jgi:hypothetical protein